MGGLQKERWFYLLLVTLVATSVFVGFAQTYLTTERLLQSAEALPMAVHVHGISFLVWYGLIVLQAILVLRGGMPLHRWLGTASLALALIMVAAGLLVVSVRMESGLIAGDQFWSSFSLVILSNLVLFSIFYGAALFSRSRPDSHRRYMLLAAAAGSGAAQFRSLVALFGPGFYAVPAGILATNLFVVIAMIGDRLIRGRISQIYLVALPATVLFECAMLGLAFTAAGIRFQQVLVGWFRPLFGLY